MVHVDLITDTTRSDCEACGCFVGSFDQNEKTCSLQFQGSKQTARNDAKFCM
jgi:hypothetical protein